jgi:hypothetical protein
VINKIDLAPMVGASLEVMATDAKTQRGARPFVFTNLKTGQGLDTVIAFILDKGMADVPHNLIVGIARIGGTDFRYKLYFWDGVAYQKSAAINPALPILFKPMGTPKPEANYIASDADYVDFITELMGGFSIPPEVKEVRKGKQYLFMGLRLNRDTERMVMSDMIYSAAEPAGWALIQQPD